MCIHNIRRNVIIIFVMVVFLFSIWKAHGKADFDINQRLKEASTLYYIGDLQASAGLYREILTYYPDHNEARLNLAAVYKDAGEPGKASLEYIYLLSSNENDGELLFQLGWTLFCSGEYEDSIVALERALKLYSRQSEILYVLGLAKSRLGKDEEASIHLSDAIKLEPGHALARLELGNVSMKLEEFQKAIDSYESVLKYESALKGVHGLLGDAYLRLNESAQALESLEKASRVEPDNKVIASKLEEVKSERPDIVQAIEEVKEAARRNLVLRRVSPPPGIEDIPRVHVRIFKDAREVRFQVGGDFSVFFVENRLPIDISRDKNGVPMYSYTEGIGTIKGKANEEWTIHRVSGSFEVLKDGVLVGRSTLPRILIIPDYPADVILLYDISYGTGYFWAGEEDRSYRGIFEFIADTNDKFIAVNDISLEEYLYSVVPSEMPAYWHMDALKAQAVAARSYTLIRLNKISDFDVDSSVQSAYYKGVKGEVHLSTQAVDETCGEVIYYGNSIIDAVYSSNHGGYAESSADVWGGPETPYLQGKEEIIDQKSTLDFPLPPMQLHEWIKTSPFSFSMPGKYGSSSAYRWRSILTRDEMERKLRESGRDIGVLTGIIPLARGQGGVVKAIRFQGTKGQYVVEKDAIRSVLGGLKSNRFVMETSYGEDGLPEQVFFYGSGFGHLVGMSQTGAANMADRGYNYKEILEHYYSRIQIRKVY